MKIEEAISGGKLDPRRMLSKKKSLEESGGGGLGGDFPRSFLMTEWVKNPRPCAMIFHFFPPDGLFSVYFDVLNHRDVAFFQIH